MNSNSLVTILLCSHLCLKDVDRPFEPKEWSNLAANLMKINKTPGDILDFSDEDFRSVEIYGENLDRVKRLIDRSATISFELDKLSQMGINIVTRADKLYPKKLKHTLKNGCPPLFYTCGDLSLLNNDFIGFVGSRSTAKKDEEFTQRLTNIFINKGFGIVSGGAKGIDQISSFEAMNNGGVVTEYLANGMIQKIKKKEYINAIRDGRVVLLSATKPDSGFNAGIAMMRNKYIYSQSVGTIVVKSDYNKGGTWSGATENLRNEWCKEFCWNNPKYDGNQGLIKKGAIPIEDNWDGNLDFDTNKDIEKGEQIGLW